MVNIMIEMDTLCVRRTNTKKKSSLVCHLPGQECLAFTKKKHYQKQWAISGDNFSDDCEGKNITAKFLEFYVAILRNRVYF